MASIMTYARRMHAIRPIARCLATSKMDTLLEVQNYYGKILQTNKDLKTTACTTGDRPPPVIRNALAAVPMAIKEKYYGCGVSVPAGIEGLDVLDLGSGSGQDCYIAAQLVGPTGSVTGLDMTDEQLDVARTHADDFTLGTLGYPENNMRFVKGFIESIESAGVQPQSIDLAVSNCVVNLSPDKPAVIKGVYDALRDGGEFFFSDVYADRRLPEAVRQNEVLWGECLAGALYEEDFHRICDAVGFRDIRELKRAPIDVTDPELQELLGCTRFWSITYRCFKLPDLETKCEDYGQVAVYKGTIPGYRHAYALDDHHIFESGKPMLVCGNTASMVGDSWLAQHFEVIGNRDIHYGLFDCSNGSMPPVENSSVSTAAPSSSGCC